MMEIFVVCIYAALGIGWYHHQKKGHRSDAQAEDTLLFQELQQREARLHRDTERLQQIEQLITDLEICDPDVLEKPTQMQWSSANGQNRSYCFWMDGGHSTQQMLQTAYEERLTLRTSLLEQINEMYDTVVTQSVTERCVSAKGEG